MFWRLDINVIAAFHYEFQGIIIYWYKLRKKGINISKTNVKIL